MRHFFYSFTNDSFVWYHFQFNPIYVCINILYLILAYTSKISNSLAAQELIVWWRPHVLYFWLLQTPRSCWFWKFVCNVLTCIFRDTFSPGLKNKIILTKKQFWSHERLISKILWTSNCKMSAVYIEKILGLNFLTKRKGTIWWESKLKIKIKSTNKNFLSLGSLFDSSKLNTTYAYTPSRWDLKFRYTWLDTWNLRTIFLSWS